MRRNRNKCDNCQSCPCQCQIHVYTCEQQNNNMGKEVRTGIGREVGKAIVKGTLVTLFGINLFGE